MALNAPGVHTSHSGGRTLGELDVRRGEPESAIDVSTLPSVNAALNAAAACFLTAGYFFIRRKNVRAHQMSMVAAFLTSSLFLASYLYYHYQVGSVAFTGQGWVRPVYFTSLVSHIVLAALIPPLALVTLYRAVKAASSCIDGSPDGHFPFGCTCP